MRACHDGIPAIRSPITVSIPAELKQQALRHGVPFSRTLEEALEQRIADLERAKLGGTPAPGPTVAETKGAP